MLYFRNDYGTGAHPAVWEALCRTNGQTSVGYGMDEYCARAAETIRTLCRCPGAAVHFLMGGTQVNKTAIGAFLRPYESVVAAATGHICVHEAGAVEQTGHQVRLAPAPDGKLTPELLRAAGSPGGDHTTLPRLAYISNTTELGTVYTREELRSLRAACGGLGLYLYCDGARLGSAMDAGGTGFADYAETCDAFTIGGTKNGLLFGEALVLVNPALQPGFRSCMKQQGAMLAKGRLLGVQFQALLEDGLYLRLAHHANRLAGRLAEGLGALEIPLLVPARSNQVFPILPDGAVDALGAYAEFEVERRIDETHSCIRFVTAWDTEEADVEALLDILEKLMK